MLEDLFLFYANNPFRDNPEKLTGVFDLIKPHGYFPSGVGTAVSWNKLMEILINNIIRYAQYDGPKSPQELRQETADDIFYKHIVDIAFYAVFGANPQGKPRCSNCKFRWLASRNNDDVVQNLKCFECAQTEFVNVLTMIASGTPYEEFYKDKEGNRVKGTFDMLLEHAYDCIYTEVSISGGEIKKEQFIDVSGLTNATLIQPALITRFNDFLFSIVGYSLIEFLLHKDRRKIKKCPYCGLFFIARDIKKKFCYEISCFREYKRLQKRRQRENEPEIYVE